MGRDANMVCPGNNDQGEPDWIPQKCDEDGNSFVNGLARQPVKLTAGVYTANEVKGFHVLTAGTGDWSMTGVDGSAQTALPTAGFPVGFICPCHLVSLTVPTAAVVLAYI